MLRKRYFLHTNESRYVAKHDKTRDTIPSMVDLYRTNRCNNRFNIPYYTRDTLAGFRCFIIPNRSFLLKNLN